MRADVREDETRDEIDPRPDDDPDGGERQVERTEQTRQRRGRSRGSGGDGRHGAGNMATASGIPQRCTGGSGLAVRCSATANEPE
jgi:hypothetical protein